ncbi:MAG: DUF4079 family protein [bacterium]
MAYLHPLVGALVLALLIYVGVLGLQVRTARRHRTMLAARHERLGTVVWVAVLVSWLGGVATTVLDRPDLSLAASLHFRSGTALALLLTGSWLTARAMRAGGNEARDWHPWLGAAALLLAAAHLAAGLRLTP